MKEKEVVNTDKFDDFGEAMMDGRLTESSDGKMYRLHEAIMMAKKLGRPLTEDEMKEFEVCDVVAESIKYNVN